ncbi:hypothetical protein CLOP_g16984 [Closterium sp. NIES-67]|nr:hypothetical protein CLOP_g16984 [Closterium sp. NIES-67]
MSPPVLRIADPSRLLQPIAYESRKLHAGERNYPVHDKEMLAIVHAFKVWHCYLTGADVTVQTDHKSLQYLRAQPNLNPRQIRWLDFLESNFHYTISYKRGANNIADALKRPSAHLASIIIAKSNPLLIGLYVSACPICERMKSSRQRPTGLLQPLEPHQKSWHHVTTQHGTSGRRNGQRRHPHRRRSLDKNGAFCTLSHDNHSRRNNQTLHLHRCSSPRPTIGDHLRSRPQIHIQVLARDMGIVRHPPAILVRLPPTNRRADRVNQLDHGTTDTHQLPRPRPMGGIAAHGGICLQQCPIHNDYSLTIFPQLRVGSHRSHNDKHRQPTTVDDTPKDIDTLCAIVSAKLAALIRQYLDIFLDILPAGLPFECPQDHKIDLEPGAQPTVRTQWRLTQPELTELSGQLDYLLEKGFIRPSTSPFATPILFTPRKDGGLRMCIEYRALNWRTIKSRYPIPRADDLLKQLSGACLFLKIDLRGSYHQIRVFADDCHKTAFRTRYGSYEYTVMPFGLTNVPSNFQLTMNGVFRDLLDKCVIVYLDDILIFSKTQEQHFKDLDQVFQRLQKHRLITKGSKCEFLKSELDILGYVVGADCIKIDPKKITTIRDGKPSTNVQELQSFLGFVNHARRFIPNMAGITGPGGGRQQTAFDELSFFLMSSPMLRIADPPRPFEVLTDASDFVIGAILLQDFDDGLQPIAYESRKLQAAERNYPVHDKEMLAIVHAFKVWRCYLTGADVIVRTDHKSLQYLRAQPNLNPRYIRWLDFLERNFHYTITFKRGANNIADALTRPSAHLTSIILAKSNPLLTGLFTHEYSTDLFFTCNLHQQRMKSSRQRPAGLLQPLEPPQQPWQHVTMDFVTGLPANGNGNNAVLVVVDRLTKMAHFALCRMTITAKDTAKLFISTIVRIHGLPSAIISVRDPKFTSKFWHETWEQYGTHLQFSSAYHPQTDGQTDRTNQTMEQLIRTNCPDTVGWQAFLPMLEFSYNNTLSAMTNHSPFFLNYGMDATIPTTTHIHNPVSLY